MVQTVFPSANDVGPVEGDGRVPTEDTITALQDSSYPQISRHRNPAEQVGSGGVVSGFGVDSITGLVVTLEAGRMILRGYDCADSATFVTPALTASTFNWVFLALTKSVGLVTGFEVQVTTSATYAAALASLPADSILLFMFQTDATDVILTLDYRGSPSNVMAGSYIGDGAATRTIDLGVRPKLVCLNKLTAPRLTCWSEMLWPFPTSNQYGLFHYERATGSGLATGLSMSRENRPQLEANGFSIEDGPATVAPGGVLMDRSTFDPPNIVAGGTQQTPITVTGATVNDAAMANFQAAAINQIVLSAEVTAPDTVTVTFINNDSSDHNLPSAELIVTVFTKPDALDYELNTLNSFYFFTAWF